MKPERDFAVSRLINGKWQFWMLARGKSVKQMEQAVWYRNKGRVARDCIKAEETDVLKRSTENPVIRSPRPALRAA